MGDFLNGLSFSVGNTVKLEERTDKIVTSVGCLCSTVDDLRKLFVHFLDRFLGLGDFLVFFLKHLHLLLILNRKLNFLLAQKTLLL